MCADNVSQHMQSTTSRRYFWAVRCLAHPGRMCRCRLTSRSYCASIFDVDAAYSLRFIRTIRYDESFVANRLSNYDYVLGESRNCDPVVSSDDFVAEEELALDEEEFGGLNAKRWRTLGAVAFPTQARGAPKDSGGDLLQRVEPTSDLRRKDEFDELEEKSEALTGAEDDEADEEDDEENDEEVCGADGCIAGVENREADVCDAVFEDKNVSFCTPDVSVIDSAMQAFVSDTEAFAESFVESMQCPVNVFWLVCNNVYKMPDAAVLAAITRLSRLAPRMSLPVWTQAYLDNSRGDAADRQRVTELKARAKKLIAGDVILRRWAIAAEL